MNFLGLDMNYIEFRYIFLSLIGFKGLFLNERLDDNFIFNGIYIIYRYEYREFWKFLIFKRGRNG